MRFFPLLLLQFLLLSPHMCLATDVGKIPLTQNHKTTTISSLKKAGLIKTYGKLPLYFIENKGQLDGRVRFYEKGAGQAVFFTDKGAVFTLGRRAGQREIRDNKGLKQSTEVLSLSFVGGNKKTAITAGEKKTGHVNYFIGKDKSAWRDSIPTYGAITYNDVYKDIDIKFYGNNRNLEHDVIVRPGGDASVVKFAYEGVQGLKITDSGDLEVALTSGNITQQRPIIYQEINGERVAVAGSYKILKGEDKAFTYGFQIASYDRTKELVIDPVLLYSTYLGGSGDDNGLGIALDNTGAAYVTGVSSSTDFPNVNSVQAAYGGGLNDVFITKIDPAGTTLLYSTYLGGSGTDIGNAIAVDSSGAAYVAGSTTSMDFPIMNAIQGALVRGTDAFVTKLSPSGAAIEYSTYIGGDENDIANSIAVDSSGAAYVTGDTNSFFFPRLNPIKSNLGGRMDAFVTKISPDGSAYVYSTYLGGITLDYGRGIAVDAAGAAYVTGSTNSTDFLLMNAIQAVFGGGSEDAFVTKINPAGSAITYSTYLGGSSDESGYGLALDSKGAAYITGVTWSTDFPLLSPIQGTLGGGGDAFITKINPAGSAYVYSTYLGGNAEDRSRGIALDSTGAAYVTGYTGSPDFPFIAPLQAGFGGGFWDTFISKIDSTGKALVYSTYLGGSGDDMGHGIAVDGTGEAYLTGRTDSPDFPLVAQVQGAPGGGMDAFLTRVSNTPSPAVYLSISPDATSVAKGATLGCTLKASNTTAVEQCFDYFENITLPNGNTYPATGELFGPVNLCLKAGASKSVHLTHGVPRAAQVGAYVYNAFVSVHPTYKVSEARFNFNITSGFKPAMQSHETSWQLIENGFRK